MKKKLLVIGVISIFLLTSIISLTAVGLNVEKTKLEDNVLPTNNGGDIHKLFYTGDFAAFFDREDLEIEPRYNLLIQSRSRTGVPIPNCGVFTNVYIKGECDSIWEFGIAPWDDPIWEINNKRVELKFSVFIGHIEEYESGRILLSCGTPPPFTTLGAINFHLDVLE